MLPCYPATTSIPCTRWRRWMPNRALLVLLLSMVLAPGVSRAQEGIRKRTIVLYVTDFGINQWSEKLLLGADFRLARHQVFPELPPAAQILAPMPDDQRFVSMSDQQLSREIATAVGDRIQRGVEMGLDTFEVQLVQNVNTGGYFSKDRQEAVSRFVGTAFSGLAPVVDGLRERGYGVATRAIVGSNGVKALTDNVPAWSGFLGGADFFDGRAFLTPMVETIEALGAENVRFFATHGDLPAPYTPIGFRSVGSFDTIKDLKNRFPQVSAFLLSPLQDLRPLGSGHLAGMLHPDGDFALSEYVGGGRMRTPLPWTVKGRDLRPVGIAGFAQAGDRAASFHPAPGPSYDRLQESVERFNQVMEGLELVLGERILPEHLGDGLGLLPAIIEDAKASRHSTFHPLASHTLEGVARLVLGKFPDLMERLQVAGRISPSFKLPPTLFGVDELVAGLSSQLGRGRMGVEELTHYLDGISRMTAAITGGMVGGAKGAQVGERAASFAISTLRGVTEPLFLRAARRLVQREMLEQWRTLQERRLADGLPPLRLEEMFKPPLLEEAGFDPTTVQGIDLSARWASETWVAAARELGGVDITVEPRVKDVQLDDERRSVLEARPADDSLSWEAASPPKPPEEDESDDDDSDGIGGHPSTDLRRENR